MTLEKYFSVPYGNMIWIYNNPVTISDINTKSFKEILSHQNAINGRSTALEIHEAIVSAVGPMKGQTVLDVGAKSGHFSYLMAEEGAKVIALEKDALPCEVIAHIALLKGYNIGTLNMKIEYYKLRSKIDLCLMLNTFDHLLRDDEEKAIDVLKNISRSVPKMALMMGPHPTVGSIPDYIEEHSWYTKSREILSTSYSNRLLYLFEREQT